MTTTGGAPQLADDVAPDPPEEPPSTQTRIGDALTRAAVPIGAVVAAPLVGVAMLLALGANPIEGYAAMLGSTRSWFCRTESP